MGDGSFECESDCRQPAEAEFHSKKKKDFSLSRLISLPADSYVSRVQAEMSLIIILIMSHLCEIGAPSCSFKCLGTRARKMKSSNRSLESENWSIKNSY